MPRLRYTRFSDTVRVDNRTLRGPDTIRVVDLDNPTAPPVLRVPRQSIRVGSVVSVAVPSRTQYVEWRVPGGYTSTLVPRNAIGVVESISPDGRLFELVQLFDFSGSGWVDSGSGELVFVNRYVNRNTGAATAWQRFSQDVLVPRDVVPTGVEAQHVARRALAAMSVVARIGHIRKVWNPKDLPPSLLAALKSERMSDAVVGMYARLGELCTAGREDRLAWTGPERLSVLRDSAGRRQKTNDAVKQYIKLARSAIANGWGVNKYLNAALAEITRNVNQIRHSYEFDVAKVAKKLANYVSTSDTRVYYADCGHFHVAPPNGREYAVALDTAAPSRFKMGTACPLCATTAVRAQYDTTSPVVWALPNLVPLYCWPDEVWRATSPPKIIGSYHSCKDTVGYTQPLVPRPKGKLGWPTIGFELEVEATASNESKRNAFAIEMRKLVTEKFGGSETASKRYLGFENDGSLDAGFECVSGWTDLRTHATVMRHVLLDDRGRNRWAGKLLSHKTTTCGLHVHIQKPDSLVHAAKVRYFMSSPIFKDLVKAVARRYNTSYAKVACRDQSELGYGGDYGTEPPAKAAASYVKWNKRARHEATDVSVKRMRLNEDRYEHVNFHNPATMEFRVYRGTTVYGTFMACLEMTQAVWFYCRDTAASSMTVNSFLRYLERPEMLADTPNLRRLLKLKGFQVQVPNPPKDTKPAEDVDGDQELMSLAA